MLGLGMNSKKAFRNRPSEAIRAYLRRPLTAGNLGEEAVLVNVDSALQRLSVRGLLPHGSLAADLGQWLGVAIAPQHDALTDASVQLQPLASTSGETKGPVALNVNADQTAWISPIRALQGKSKTLQFCKESRSLLRSVVVKGLQVVGI